MKKRQKRYGKLLSLILIMVLITSTCDPAFAATARATTMKLEKTEGKVKVKTQNGIARTLKNGMRLYNGNSVDTQKESYAFISLDSSKAVKLDQNSNAFFRQNGKKLELLVKRGQLFFNVSTKLKDNETMNVRTSTMVTGVRGTCGIVEVVSPKVSKLYLLEGKMVLGGDHPVTVYGGEIATVDKAIFGELKIDVDKMQETDIPIFAVEEVLNDPELQNRIEENTDLSIEKMEEVLESASQTEENPSEEKPEETESPEQPDTSETPSIPNMPSVPVIPYPPSDNTGETNPPSDNTEGTNPPSDNTGETNPPSDNTGETNPPSGDSSDENETETDAPEEPVIPEKPVIPEEPNADVTLTGDLTVDNIETALNGNNAVKIASTGTITMVSQSITIPAGKTLMIDTVFSSTETGGYKGFYMDKNSKIIVEPNAVLFINGSIMGGHILLNYSELYNKGTIDGAAMTAFGSVTMINYNIIKLQQAFTKTGSDTTVDYQGSADSVFISNMESTAMPAEEGSSGTLLAYAVSGNSIADDEAATETETVQFIYADYLNSQVEYYMKLLSENSSNITWKFSKEAVVPPASTQ